jgi:hypothetical protein
MKARIFVQGGAILAALGFVVVGSIVTSKAQSSDTQFSQTDNPVSLNVPVQTPNVTPAVVTILSNHEFGNAPPPATSNVKLPQGKWSKVVLNVTGTEQGRQFDRLLQVFAGNTQILNSVTPEPTAAGITWHVQKDVTQYLPLFQGDQTFTTAIDNYMSSVYTGAPKVTITLSFYPERGNAPQTTPYQLPVPDQIVPLQSSPDEVYLPKNSWSGTVNLPNDITSAYLDLNATAQIGEEFWWGEEPAYRQIDVSIDGKPAGVVYPYPYIYTGGVNPMMWRPITAVNTLDMPTYRVDLSPFAGLLGGKHTITLSVEGNTGYWLLNSSLFLYEDGGKPTTGSITKDTLTFPAQPSYSTSNALNSSNYPLFNETSNQQYEIQGTLKTENGTWTRGVKSSVIWSNDQVVMNNEYQMVHGSQDVTTDETLTNPQGHSLTRESDSSYTLDAPNAFVSNPDGSFLLPTQVTQSLNEVHSLSGLGQPGYNSSLYESVQAYGILQEGSVGTITQGATTGVLQYNNSLGANYRENLMARGGKLVVNRQQSSPGGVGVGIGLGNSGSLPGWPGMPGMAGKPGNTLTQPGKNEHPPIAGEPGVKTWVKGSTTDGLSH